MSTAKTLNTATLAFVTLAAVALGALIGLAIVQKRPADDEAAAPAASVAPSGLPDEQALAFRRFDGRTAVAVKDLEGNVVAAASGENFVRAQQNYRSETVTVTVPGDGAIEYKAVMRGGAPLVYSWRADGPLYFDFHGHDNDNESGFFTRYDDGDSVADAGAIVAAYSGQHGWYWQNRGTEPVSVTLTVSGFFDDLVELTF